MSSFNYKQHKRSFKKNIKASLFRSTSIKYKKHFVVPWTFLPLFPPFEDDLLHWDCQHRWTPTEMRVVFSQSGKWERAWILEAGETAASPPGHRWFVPLENLRSSYGNCDWLTLTASHDWFCFKHEGQRQGINSDVLNVSKLPQDWWVGEGQTGRWGRGEVEGDG